MAKKKKSKADILRRLSRRMQTSETTKLPLKDGEEDLSRVEGCDVDFYVTVTEPTLRDVEEFQVSSMRRVSNDDGDLVVQARPVDALLSLVENKVIVDARLPVVKEDGNIGHVRINGSIEAMSDLINENLTYAMAMVVTEMILEHLGLADDSEEAEVIEKAKN